MSKPYYTDYVRHALRFYSRHENSADFKTDVDKKNWIACANAVKEWDGEQLQCLLSVYSGYDTLPDEVYKASIKYNIKQSQVWDMMKDLEHRVAANRGLI